MKVFLLIYDDFSQLDCHTRCTRGTTAFWRRNGSRGEFAQPSPRLSWRSSRELFRYFFSILDCAILVLVNGQQSTCNSRRLTILTSTPVKRLPWRSTSPKPECRWRQMIAWDILSTTSHTLHQYTVQKLAELRWRRSSGRLLYWLAATTGGG